MIKLELEDGQEYTICDQKRGDCVYVSQQDGSVTVKLAHLRLEIDKDGDIYLHEGVLMKDDKRV
jgi:hypothetical protein